MPFTFRKFCQNWSVISQCKTNWLLLSASFPPEHLEQKLNPPSLQIFLAQTSFFCCQQNKTSHLVWNFDFPYVFPRPQISLLASMNQIIIWEFDYGDSLVVFQPDKLVLSIIISAFESLQGQLTLYMMRSNDVCFCKCYFANWRN